MGVHCCDRVPAVPLFRVTPDAPLSVEATTFSAVDMLERRDPQRLLRDRLEVLGDDLLLVAEEYGDFEGSQRRIDLLALDRSRTLVVIELKRTADGGHMELQALRYAAMVSTMTWNRLIDVYARQHQVEPTVAQATLEDWVEDGTGEDGLSDQVRIILASADFGPEVTSTVLWLTQQYSLDTECFRLTPYRLGGEVLIDVRQTIPLPDAREFQVQQRQKTIEKVAARSTGDGRDYTKYDVALEGYSARGLNKRQAVRALATWLVAMDVDGEQVRSVLTPTRWLAVQPEVGESSEEAFSRQHPGRTPRFWFDVGMVDEAGTWLMPQIGGIRTEEFLSSLEKLGAPHLAATWDASPRDVG